jgi:hypothetical protein
VKGFKIKGLLSRQRVVAGLTLFVLLSAALFIRRDVYTMPNLRGDQRIYVGAAAKLDKDGIGGYTLRGVRMRTLDDYFIQFYPSSSASMGELLIMLTKIEGAHYYDMPVLTTPPLFSYALMFSYRIFGPEEGFVIPYNRWTPDNGVYTLRQYAGKHLYAFIVPLFFSLMLVILVFMLSEHLFGYEPALWAAFLMVVCPTDIMASQKIWADDMTAVFAVLSLLAFLKAQKHNNIFLSIISGVSAGLGATTKATGGFIVFVIVLYYIWSKKNEIFTRRIFRVAFDKHLLIFLAAGFVTALPWYGFVITRTYGLPWHLREPGLIAKDAIWFTELRVRPWFIYLVNIPMQTPLFFLGYLAVAGLFLRGSKKDNFVLLFLWYTVFLILLRRGKEERYMLPAIPAIAVSSGFFLKKVRLWVTGRTNRITGFLVMAAIALFCGIWSVYIARKVILMDGALIKFPI